MLRAATERLAAGVAEFSRRRHGDDPLAVTLKRRRIYILPTGFGLVFACLVFAMLLGSINYGMSLGFALTFLLGGLGLVSMHHCHNNLLGTSVRFAGAAPVFAGGETHFRIALRNHARVSRHELGLDRAPTRAGPVDLEPGQSKTLTLAVAARERGVLTLDRFAVSTRHPGNLFRAWTWIHMDARCLVYPRPAGDLPRPVGSDGHGSTGMRDRDDADFTGLRDAVPGDSPRRIAWKAFARSDQLMVKQFSGADEQPCLFDWDDLPPLGVEERLSQLTRWCLDAADELDSFGLKLPGRTIPLGTGDRHLHECLGALALFEGAT